VKRRALTIALVCALGGIAAAQRQNQAEDESAAFVEEGRSALRKGDLDDAAKSLDQAISLNPRRVEAYVLRSAVYAAKKQYKDGIALMRRAQAIAPNDPEVLTALGTHFVLSGDVATGVPLLQQVVAKEPTRYDAQLLLGHHWHDAGKWSESITALEAYFSARPNALAGEDARHRVELADAYLRNRQPTQALALFDKSAQSRTAAKDPSGVKGSTELRARMGAAWATAAIDCKKARPMLRELEVIADQHPEVWLVDGQCALALGDSSGALGLGRKYLEKSEKSTAAGHALVGEALAARGNLAEARKELETARSLDPQRRRWTVRLAIVLLRANQFKDALATLEQLGPPTTPSADPDWWVGVAEAQLASGDAAAVVSRVSPIVAELPGNAPIRVVLGAALVATGAHEVAVTTLEEAEAIQSTQRSRRLLAESLTAVAAGTLSANDAAGAEPLLARADQLDGNAIVWRNLGIARLALGRAAEATATLDRAAKVDPGAINLMLAARAHAGSSDLAGARSLYERALAADKDNVEIAIDWAALEVGPGGDPAVAVATLEKTANAARSGPLAARHKAALATARHAAGLAQLRAGNGTKAVELLRAAAVPGEQTLARKCDLAVAAVVAGDVAAALTALKAVQGQSCPFPPPADTQAAPILIAFTEGLNAKKAPRALDRLTALGGKSTGPAAAMLGTAIRVVALNAAQDAYRSGKLAEARKYLASAKAANARVGTDEVAQNLAVLDLADGRLDAAIKELERLAPRVPEALVNLGIAYERRGDHVKALDAWRRAKKAGVRFSPVSDWIESKERIYGEASP
jgi:tetratricopeptide (TPR) repeat protein